jgi:hypothetical protein
MSTSLRLGWFLGGLLIVGLFASARLAVHAADPVPAAAKSPEDMKPTDAAKPAAARTSPHNWPPGEVIFEQSDAEKKIREALRQPAECDYLNTDLESVTVNLTLQHHIKIAVDAHRLAAEGKGVDESITASFRNIPLGKMLNLILDGHGLTTVIKDDVLIITTKIAASQPENLSTRVYQVHDLVVAANDPTASQPDFDSLINVITSNVRQSDWAENGGTIGVISTFNGPGVLALVIQHDERGHVETERLLKSLRAARVQVIFDVQAKQPLQPHPPMGGVGSSFADPAASAPSPQPTGTAVEAQKSPPPGQSRGGGFF